MGVTLGRKKVLNVNLPQFSAPMLRATAVL